MPPSGRNEAPSRDRSRRDSASPWSLHIHHIRLHETGPAPVGCSWPRTAPLCAVASALQGGFHDFDDSLLNLRDGKVDDMLTDAVSISYLRNRHGHLDSDLLRCALLQALSGDAFHALDDWFLDLWVGKVGDLLTDAIGNSCLRSKLDHLNGLLLRRNGRVCDLLRCALLQALFRGAFHDSPTRSTIRACSRGWITSASSA